MTSGTTPTATLPLTQVRVFDLEATGIGIPVLGNDSAWHHHGVRLDDAHTARADAVAAGSLVLMRQSLFRDLASGVLLGLQRAAYRGQVTGFEAYRRRTEPGFDCLGSRESIGGALTRSWFVSSSLHC